MTLTNKPKSTKIKRSFTIEPDLFFQFKSEVAKHNASYSTVLENLVSQFLKNPNNSLLYK